MNVFKGIVRSTVVPGRLRRLYRVPKRSPELELAFADFYDSAKREEMIDNLHGAKLQMFVNFLDEVRRISPHPSHRLII